MGHIIVIGSIAVGCAMIEKIVSKLGNEQLTTIFGTLGFITNTTLLIPLTLKVYSFAFLMIA